MNKDNKRPNLIHSRTKEWDYYNRPSLKTSYTLAVIGLCGIIVLLIGAGILKLIEAA